MNTKMNDETKMETAKSQYPNRGERSEYYCDACEDEPLLHDGEGGYYCECCDEDDDGFEDCECGYTHHYEDKCPKGENTQHYEKCPICGEEDKDEDEDYLSDGELQDESTLKNIADLNALWYACKERKAELLGKK